MFVYISAPYSKGDIVLNVRQVCLVANDLIKMGHIPYVPHLTMLWHLVSPKPYEDWIKLDVALLSRFDCVLRLAGDSKGADTEVEEALKLGIPVYYSLEELEKHV
jgi:hypothetical protein